MSSFEFLAGETLLIDKPLDWSSFDVVNKIRYAVKRHLDIKKIKVGHAGTLDPLATGLVIVCTGKNTKKIEQYMGLEKEYTGCITLGGSTASFDLETDIDSKGGCNSSQVEIQKAAEAFLGTIEQTPPIFSAKKIGGKKAYELARQGKEVKMRVAQVHVSAFDILSVNPSKKLEGGLDCEFRIACSKGTYIRSLANDLGEKLKCGGFLSSLRRTKIGDLNVADAVSPEQFIGILNSATKSED